MDKDGNFQIVVRTAHGAPKWAPWAVYAILAGSGYMFDQTASPLWVIPIAILAVVTTHLFFTTYNSMVHLYNEMRIRDAILAQFKPKEKQVRPPQIQAGQAIETGVKLLGADDTPVDAGSPSSEESLILRLRDALIWINDKAKTVGDARDRAWRAIEHDQLKAIVDQYKLPLVAPKAPDGE